MRALGVLMDISSLVVMQPKSLRRFLHVCCRWPIVGCLIICLTGCANLIAPYIEYAHARNYPIVSPRVPFYQYDATRRIDAQFIEIGVEYMRFWFVDPERGIDNVISVGPPQRCEFSTSSLNRLFEDFEAFDKPSIRMPIHYASDDPDLLVFVNGGPSAFSATSTVNAFSHRLSVIVSENGGRSFVSREPVLSISKSWLKDQQRWDDTEVLVSVSESSHVRFLVVRLGIAYVGIDDANPGNDLRYEDILRPYLGRSYIAIFAFDPRDPREGQRARVLRGDELRSFQLPVVVATTHRADQALIKRARPSGRVGYHENERRAYVEGLRPDFPEWAAAQRIDIGSPEFETRSDRETRIAKTKNRGDACSR